MVRGMSALYQLRGRGTFITVGQVGPQEGLDMQGTQARLGDPSRDRCWEGRGSFGSQCCAESVMNSLRGSSAV